MTVPTIGLAYNRKTRAIGARAQSPRATVAKTGSCRVPKKSRPETASTPRSLRPYRPRRVRRVGQSGNHRRRGMRPLPLRRSRPPRGHRRFPANVCGRQTRHRLQHRRGTSRSESRSARPRDLRVLRRPLLRQRPVHARALPRQGAHEGDPRASRRADGATVASFATRIEIFGARGSDATLPLFAKPVHEGSSKGITEKNFSRPRRSS